MQTGRLEPAFRFAPYSSTPLLAQLERRPGLGPIPLGSFVYEPHKGALQTVALNGDTVVDHIRFQVRPGSQFSGSALGLTVHLDRALLHCVCMQSRLARCTGIACTGSGQASISFRG